MVALLLVIPDAFPSRAEAAGPSPSAEPCCPRWTLGAGLRAVLARACRGWLGSWAPSVACSLAHWGCVLLLATHLHGQSGAVLPLHSWPLWPVQGLRPHGLRPCLTDHTARDSVGQPGLEGPLAGSALTPPLPPLPCRPPGSVHTAPHSWVSTQLSQEETAVDWS